MTITMQGYASDLSIEAGDGRLERREYSPYLNRSYPDRVFFGDTHPHTSYSTDAGIMGNSLGPDEAFRFARGEHNRRVLNCRPSWLIHSTLDDVVDVGPVGSNILRLGNLSRTPGRTRTEPVRRNSAVITTSNRFCTPHLVPES